MLCADIRIVGCVTGWALGRTCEAATFVFSFCFYGNQLNSKFKLNYGTFKQIFNAAVNEVY